MDSITTKLEAEGFAFECGKDVPAVLYKIASPKVKSVIELCRALYSDQRLIGEEDHSYRYYALALRLHGVQVHLIFRDFIDESFLIYLLENRYLSAVHVTYVVCESKVYHWPQTQYHWLLHLIKQKANLSIAALTSEVQSLAQTDWK
jgi:hypothetical protein